MKEPPVESEGRGMADLRSLPSIDQLLRREEVQAWEGRYPRDKIVQSLRDAVAEARTAALRDGAEPQVSGILERAESVLGDKARASLVPVVNATGVLLHTNLGRSPLSAMALRHIEEVCSGYCNLELDLESGERGHRHLHLQPLLTQLTGAEAALVVNNCAAAMLLIMDEFARGREVVVSRGELVEIGGSFRIPEVIERSGARLREVGTTNRTYPRDFAAALDENTAVLLSTHLSNFRQEGFVHSPEPVELVELARAHGLVSVLDLGSGLLDADFLPSGVSEPGVREAVAQGWDVVAFSGDKLLGAAQAGIILGRAEHIARLAKNPWMRALRLDKLRLAALQGSLLDLQFGPERVPLLHMAGLLPDEVKRRAERLCRRLKKRVGSSSEITVQASQASLGGGTTPGQLFESWCVCLRHARRSLDELARTLRLGSPAVLARRHAGWLWFDLRTVPEKQVSDLERALVQVLA